MAYIWQHFNAFLVEVMKEAQLMKKFCISSRKYTVFLVAFFLYTFVLVNSAPAPGPPPPPPPPVPAAGDIAYEVTFGAMAVYGVWKIRGRK